jgi:serine/threonine-protein kinase RsbW
MLRQRDGSPRMTSTAAMQRGTIELHIPSQLGWERTAMDTAASVAKRMGFPTERIEDIKTAVSEATTNAIEHGNHEDGSQSVLVILVPESESLAISVRDQSATPFAPAQDTAIAPSIEDKIAGISDARGWGMFLIRSLVDEVHFSSSSLGNEVRMVIHLDR